MFETIRIETDPRGVAHLWLAREDKHNALSAQMIRDLTAAAAQLGTDPAVRVVVLAAQGKSFCAGGDLGWMQDQMRADAETRRAGARELAMMLNALNTLPKPLIARVQGNAFGGGVGMISVCDIAIAAETARFGLTEVRLGLIPATIAPYVVARIGAAGARRSFLSGRLFDAAEALQLGLVSRVVPDEGLDAAIEAEIVPILSAAPGAVASAKALIRRLVPPPSPETVTETVAALVKRWEDPESEAGIRAFFAREKPPWAG